MHRFLFQCKFSFLLAEYPGVGLLNHMINICLTLWETVKLFFQFAFPSALNIVSIFY